MQTVPTHMKFWGAFLAAAEDRFELGRFGGYNRFSLCASSCQILFCLSSMSTSLSFTDLGGLALCLFLSLYASARATKANCRPWDGTGKNKMSVSGSNRDSHSGVLLGKDDWGGCAREGRAQRTFSCQPSFVGGQWALAGQAVCESLRFL